MYTLRRRKVNATRMRDRYKHAVRPWNKHKGVLDFLGNLIGGSKPPAPNVNSQKYTYSITNKSDYIQMVSKINTYMQEQITAVTLKTSSELSLTQSFLLNNIVAVGDVTIDLDFIQNAKVLSTSKLTVEVVQSMTQQICNSISDSIQQSFKNDTVTNTQSTLALASSKSLVDSFLAPFTGGNTQPSTQQFFDMNKTVENTITNDIQTSTTNANSTSSASNVVASITTNVNTVQSTTISNITIGGNFSLIGKFEQGLDFVMDILLENKFAQQIINSVNDSQYFSIDTSAIDTTVTKTEIQTSNTSTNETVGGMFSGLLGGLLPIAAIGGVVLVVGLVFAPSIFKAATPLAKEVGVIAANVESGGMASKIQPGNGVKRGAYDLSADDSFKRMRFDSDLDLGAGNDKGQPIPPKKPGGTVKEAVIGQYKAMLGIAGIHDDDAPAEAAKLNAKGSNGGDSSLELWGDNNNYLLASQAYEYKPV